MGTWCHCPLPAPHGPWSDGCRGVTESLAPTPAAARQFRVSARRCAALPARRRSSGEAMRASGETSAAAGLVASGQEGARGWDGEPCGADARSSRRSPAPLLQLPPHPCSSSSSFSSSSSSRLSAASPRAHFLLRPLAEPLLCSSLSLQQQAGPGAGKGPGPRGSSPSSLLAAPRSRDRSPERARWLPGWAAEASSLNPHLRGCSLSAATAGAQARAETPAGDRGRTAS